jgi:hypothetical protein
VPSFIVDAQKLEDLRDLIRHCWVHSGYQDCGYLQMTTQQKNLYNKTIGRKASEVALMYGWVPLTNEEFEKKYGENNE